MTTPSDAPKDDKPKNALYEAALQYHRRAPAGKWGTRATKPLATQRDLSLAYSPGVAAACEAIVEDPNEAATLTSRGNLVAVITNGSAVLGLGNIGPLASKPVMEGKAVLFRKFAGIDAVDIELNAPDAESMIRTITALEPSFGAINLEDIKAPECFEVEAALREALSIPVFHDDQHGTAIIASAALRNALEITGRDIKTIKVVSTGGGAASLACLNLFCAMGLPRENVWLVDIHGVVYEGRSEDMNPHKALYAQPTDARALDQVIGDADVFLGLSAGGVLKPSMVERMADRPIILALANPTPEIDPAEARAVRPDAIIATGRSDFPNQVNNVLCFPFIFRGALDVGATTINEAMKLACVEAIAALAKQESSEVVDRAYKAGPSAYGGEYIIPKPFDPRLMLEIAPAVAKAAMDSGVAQRPIADFEAYQAQLERFVYRSGFLMKPIFDQARKDPRRVAFAEGEDERVLRAAQVLVDEGLAKPVLVGRPDVIETRLDRLGLRLDLTTDVDVVNPQKDDRFQTYWQTYHALMERRGVTPESARTIVRTNTTVIAALMVHLGDAEAMICGSYGQYDWHLRYVLDVIGKRPDVREVAALSALVVGNRGTLFIGDTHCTHTPSPEELAEAVLLSAEQVRRFGMTPKVALLSHASFGSESSPSAQRMRDALAILHQRAPELEVEGEMQADLAFDEETRTRLFPNSHLTGQANLLIMPNLDAANIASTMLVGFADGLLVGPILVGTARPAHIVTPSVTARGLVNITALAVTDAQGVLR